MNYKDFNLGDWIGHISGAIEDERELDWYEMRDLAEFLSKLPKWIPVSEMLPKAGEEVLVSGYDTYNKRVIIAKYQGEQYGFTCGLVSAWMPLPKPYELLEGSEEDKAESER